MSDIHIHRLEIVTPNFFSIPLKKMTVESDPVINRTYFIKDDRIVAVATTQEKTNAQQD